MRKINLWQFLGEFHCLRNQGIEKSRNGNLTFLGDRGRQNLFQVWVWKIRGLKVQSWKVQGWKVLSLLAWRTFQPRTFQPQTYQPWTFQPWIFQHQTGGWKVQGWEVWVWKVHDWKIWVWKVWGWKVHGRKVWGWKVWSWSLGLKNPGLKCPSTAWQMVEGHSHHRLFNPKLQPQNFQKIFLILYTPFENSTTSIAIAQMESTLGPLHVLWQFSFGCWVT